MKKKFQVQRRASGDMSLNITAMADIFTVILVFLLMGYSSGAVNITPSSGVTLPGAGASATHIEALKIEISKSSIQVESKPVMELQEYRAKEGEVATDGTLKALSGALKVERERQIALAGANTDVKLDARVVLIADQKVPYSTIRSVLASAAVQGYTDFKLAVFNRGQ
jgi:biopolymer transport protein ExbD